MAESFENLDNILRDWKKIRYQKSCPGIELVQEAKRRKTKTFFFLRKQLAVPVGSRARLSQTQNWPCFVSNLTNPIKKMLMRFSQSECNYLLRLMSGIIHPNITTASKAH